MDKTIRKRSAQSPTNPIIALAGWHQFNTETRIAFSCVESRMLLWCQKGKGAVQVNGETFDLLPGDWVFLPWKHRIRYLPDSEDPFLTAGIHLLDHNPRVPVVFRIAHHAGEDLAGRPERRELNVPGFTSIVRGHFHETDRLGLLGTYIIERFYGETPDESCMRDLARTLLGELRLAVQTTHARPLPHAIRRLQEYMLRLHEDLGVDTLARLAGCSTASVHRLFRDYTGMSPGRYVAKLRADRAALLLRTTSLSIHEIGIQIGFSDPFYFSRFFKQKMGLSPRAYQRSRRLF